MVPAIIKTLLHLDYLFTENKIISYFWQSQEQKYDRSMSIGEQTLLINHEIAPT